MATSESQHPIDLAPSPDVDAVIIGAGFAGMYMIYKLHEMGFTVAGFERSAGVGGVWNWNNYPGARCDSESLAYSYSFSEELQRDWNWPERFSGQEDILRYANEVADRFGLRRHFKFDTNVVAATWDEATLHWVVRTDHGHYIRARFLIAAVGCLSAARVPEIPGMADYEGDLYHTGEWPRTAVKFAGKRVGVIGTGSSGIQVATTMSRTAKHLTVFQRTPSFCVPAHNRPMDPEHEKRVKERYAEFRQLMRKNGQGFVVSTDKNWAEVSPQEREEAFQKRWDYGGSSFLFTFKDIMTNRLANDDAANFIRKKIRSIVKDPDVADKLCPKNYPIGAKRLCIDTGYYTMFNQANVSLVDIRSNPISRITQRGVQLTDGRLIELDILVFATGYDAMTGSVMKIDIRGSNGLTLQDKWRTGPRTYLGLATEGFPNLFILTGPGSPSVLANVFVSIEQHVEFTAEILEMMRANGFVRIEPEVESEDTWTQHVADVAATTLWPQADSWYLGANVPGKPRVFMVYVGGSDVYRKECEAVRQKGYEGFVLTKSLTARGARAERMNLSDAEEGRGI
jgi:cyclohexanone monooxygenase